MKLWVNVVLGGLPGLAAPLALIAALLYASWMPFVALFLVMASLHTLAYWRMEDLLKVKGLRKK